jgi:hypothetical protein
VAPAEAVKRSPRGEANEPAIEITPSIEDGRARTRIEPPASGTTLTSICRPDGSFVESTRSTPASSGPNGLADTTSRAE